MWLQLSPVLPKDILRAKHPCRGPHSQTPHEFLYKSTVKRNGFVTVWLGTDAFLLQDTVSERHPCNATSSPALPPWAQATIHRGLIPQEETGGLFGSASGGVSNNGAFPLLHCSDKKSTGPRDFTNRHHITQPICVYGRLPECISAIPNLYTVELQLPAFKPLSKGAQ